MAKRKFRIHVTVEASTMRPLSVDANGDVEADRFEVKDGAALFVTDGFVVLALAPETWLRVELVPVPGEKPARSRT